ncbi:MAG TPA: amidohydrolase family protein [Blastocatellia bacterium]|nr:amidohydrolase family protein [Blastocatellia bacterium]
MISLAQVCSRAARLTITLAMLALVCPFTFAQSTSPQSKPSFVQSPKLDQLLRKVVDAAVAEFGKGGLTPDKIALTVIDLNDRNNPAWASYRGREQIYPASVVKLFYLVAAHNEIEAGRLKQAPELERALHDMIVDSSNDATHLVVDAITGTTGGPELDDAALKEWMEKRNLVNRYFAGLGYEKINVNQKTWCEGPYGRERQGLGLNFENRNKLTTEAVARLMYEIVTGRAVTPARSHSMMQLLHRDPFSKSNDPDDQATAFSGKSLPPGSEYYSKAGWTSSTRHDAAYIRLPNGAEYILVVFTVDNSSQAGIIPFVSRLIAEEFSRTEPPADLAIINGRVWTGNKSQPWAEAVASRGGRLIAVGSTDEIKKLINQQTRVIDLQGRLALPGFIDDHTHFVSGGFQLLSVDLRSAATQAEFARRIKAYAEKRGPNRWITGGDWDHELWPGAPLPTKELIDAATPNNPVFVSRLDGHMALANSVALRMAKITKDTQDPPGGTIVRDPKTGEPTGVLKDAAMSLVYAIIPDPSDAEYDEALTAAMREAARNGVTSIQDITYWPDYKVYKRFRDANRLTVRVYARTPIASWKQQSDLIRRQGAGDDWLRLGGVKAFMDGSLGSTTALFFEPYNDAPSTRGLAVGDNPEGTMKKLIKEVDKAGLQCSIHAIGDKANNLLLNYFEETAKENGARDRRFRIEHAQHLIASDIPRFARLGVIPSVQPYHAIDDGRWAEKRIGPERIKTTYPFRAFLDTGATLVFGSDWTVAPLSPILGIYAAVTRATLDGKNPKGWVPEQKITVEEAVRAYTTSCAYAEFAEARKGALEVGKLADVVVLSRDIFRVAPEEIQKTDVVYTIVGGRVVFEK